MGIAFDLATRSLHDKGQPPLVQEVIAEQIIEIAKTGERDPDKICERVLQAFGIEAASDLAQRMYLQPEAVVLDFMHPAVSSRRLVDARRQARVDE